MEMVTKVGAALQQLLGPIAERVAQQTGVIQRRREFSPMSLAATFVLGYLWKPQASVDQLSKMAVQVGAEVTPQAVDQRRTPQLVTILEQLFRESLLIVVASSRSLAPMLERFPSVTVLDSTSITLPDSQQEHFAGCGGSYSTSQAAVKLQTELDLRGGGLSHVEIEPGKSPDGATVRQHARRGPGSLRIADLGYFNVPVFAEMVEAKEHFLSRLQFGTGVLLPDGTPVELLRWLEQQPGGAFIDCPILLGLKDRLPCRLIAWRVPPEQANRRRQKLRAEMKRKHGKEPSAERMAWCDWAILVTSVPPELLTPKEITVLYRARWQIELFFKELKSTLGFDQYRFQSFAAVRAWVEVAITTVLFLEHQRAQRLRDRRLTAERRAWWTAQRLHGLSAAFRQECEGRELKYLLERTKTPGGIARLQRLLAAATPPEFRSAG